MPNLRFLKLLTTTSILCMSGTLSYAQAPSAYAPWPEEKAQTITPIDQAEPYAPAYNDVEEEEATPSALEAMYARRLIDEPKQFGYDLFSSDDYTASNNPMGAVQDDFTLNKGDELIITFTGQRNDQDTYKVDTRGLLMIKDFPPIPVAGQTIAQVRDVINAQTASMYNTKAFVSLSSVRQIGVLVVGHVGKPGRKTLNVFHTVLDALNMAGGIKKDGSLRQIKLVRSGHSTPIDLYNLLMNGAPQTDIRLKDGDRIIIPPIGPTVAISGAVKRAGIFELKNHSHSIGGKMHVQKLNLNQMLTLAGGVLSGGNNRFVNLSVSNNGQESVHEISNFSTPQFSDGSILSVLKGEEKRTGTISLNGHTRRPGVYDLSNHKTLGSLLQNQDILGDDIYPLIGIIERWDSEQLTTQLIKFSVRSVLKNDFDLSMTDNDVVNIFSNQYISDVYTKNIKATVGFNSDTKKTKKSEDIYKNSDQLEAFLKEQSITVRGAVRRVGSYPIADDITLENVLSVAGGLSLNAARNNIEVTRAKATEMTEDFGAEDSHINTQRVTYNLNETPAYSITLSSGDTVRVNQEIKKNKNRTVLIIGEVPHPGTYDILAGDKVSDLIERAGGLNDQSYAEGAIFSRESERRAKEMAYRAEAKSMEQRLAAAIQRDDKAPDATQIEMVRKLADTLNNIEAVGRITVEADPAILSARPELDMLLESGDKLYIPKRPLTVRVVGEILSPSAQQFRKDKDPLDYIHEAGSFTYHADKDRTFVLFPDGSAQPLKVSKWNHKPIFIPPGSTIVVPRDPKPFDFIEGAKNISQILSNIAITSVFIDDIRD